MGELLIIWSEINAANRFAEAKLVFLVGVLVGILGFLNSGSAGLAYEVHLLAGGEVRIVNYATILALLMVLSAALPQLSPSNRWDFLIPKRSPVEVFYFLDIANFNSIDACLASYGIKFSEDELPRARRLAGQIYLNAKIASRKFAVLRYAATCVAGGWAISWVVLLYQQYVL